MASNAQKIDYGKTMEEMWEGFAGAVIPHVSSSSIQYDEMKKAFFSGAFCLFNWFMVQMDEDREPTEGDLDKVDTMHKELEAFMLKATQTGAMQ